MNPLVVIPARGGSKGLPRKNIRHLAGVPLIVYSIRCARAAGIEHVIVSTDDDEIADVARLHGAAVPFMRPAILASDTAPMMPVIAHALHASDAAFDVRHDIVVLLDPTSPGREPDDITRALAMLLHAPTASGVVAVSKPFFNPFWVGVVVEDGVLVPAFPREAKSVRRQDVPPFFRINGSLYVWRSEYVESGKHWSDCVMLPLEMPESRAFSIDDLEEFEALEAAVSSGKIKMPWMHP